MVFLRGLKETYSTFPSVYNVTLAEEQLDLISKLQNFVSTYTTGLWIALMFASGLLIWNTIRTAMFARRREIEVMKLVGATDWFIRIPFMLEGLIQGLLGGFFAVGAMIFINWRWTEGVQRLPRVVRHDRAGRRRRLPVDGGDRDPRLRRARRHDRLRHRGFSLPRRVAARAYRGCVTDFTQIRYEVQDCIATLTLSRPEKLNAFTLTMMREMISAFDMADADDSVRAVIVTGEGRAFCAGADLSGGESTFDHTETAAHKAGRVPRDGGGMLSLRIFRSQKPVIGAINGAAVGVGVTMTLPMDVRLASTSARFGFVFSRRGIVPEAASSWFLPRVVGISQALEWTYSGRVFDADEALAGGLVRSVHAPDELIPAAHALAAEIADQHRAGLRRAGAADDVAHAGSRPPDGGAPRRQPGDPRPGTQRRRPRGRRQLPREARRGVHRPCQRRPS